MLSVTEADDILAARVLPLTTETVSFQDAPGRVLAETILADRDFPPFDRVSMDGIAIQYGTLVDGHTSFPLLAIQRAGEPQQPLSDPLGCIEVMTGAMLPTGTNTVIRYEDLSITDGIATLQIPADEVTPWQNVHKQGTDRRTFDVVLSAGIRLRPVDLAVVASVGQTSLAVRQRPRVAVVSTGDELVGIDQTPLAHQIRQSNAHLLWAALHDMGLEATVSHFPDDISAITMGLSKLLVDHDVLLITGGVSAGKADYVPDILSGLGIRKHFHKIEQRPGKPMWFGTRPDNQRVVFALPGNPVSTTMCFYRYVRPYLELAMGIPGEPPLYVQLAQPVTFVPNMTYFVPVRLDTSEEGTLLAYPLPGSGSADFTNLTAADAFLELPATTDSEFPAGIVAVAWAIG